MCPARESSGVPSSGWKTPFLPDQKIASGSSAIASRSPFQIRAAVRVFALTRHG